MFWMRQVHGSEREVQMSSMGLNQEWSSKAGKRIDMYSGLASPREKMEFHNRHKSYEP